LGMWQVQSLIAEVKGDIVLKQPWTWAPHLL
jgi:hypothetical protein